MAYPTYYVEASDTLPIFFDSFDGGTGASITMTGLATTDIEIYKDGGTTQRSSENGYTLLDSDGIDFDGITGIHGFSIDLSDNSDAGFYAVGPWYHVMVSAITIDAQTVSLVAAAFRIVSATRGMTGTAVPDAAADAAGGVPISDAGGLNLDVKLANTNQVTVARMAALTDWINGGRLDLILDIIAADVVNLDGAAMRGTDSAALASEVTAARMSELDDSAGKLVAIADLIKTTVDAIPTTAMRGTDNAALASVATEARLAELDAANLPSDVADIPTTAMRGTDSAALASEVTAARMSELDDSAGKLVAIADLIKTAADAIKLETDKLTLGDAGVGVSGSIVEEVENVKALLPTSLSGGRMRSDLEAINADADVPDRLVDSLGTIQKYTVDSASFTPTTTQCQVDDVAPGSLEATDTHFLGATLIFISGALQFQRTDVTNYDGTNKRFTYTALTEAPADNDTFILV